MARPSEPTAPGAATAPADASEPRVEELFARYAQHGAPSDLALVFDRTAPALLEVAMHLARDASEAEDLLQTTFLVAIEKRRRYDPARPLVPWLGGILTKA